MNQVSFLSVSADYVGQRLDNFLIRNLKGVPKSHIYRLIRRGEVRINKKRCKPEQRLEFGDSVRIPPIRQGDKGEVSIHHDAIVYLEECILYEDNDLLVVNKPAGLATHGGTGLHYGLIEALRILRPKQSYLELAHRIDKPTSGCLLIAKKPSLLKAIHEQWTQGKVEKHYDLLVYGKWPKHLTYVDAPLLKIQQKGGGHKVQVSEKGKSSLTAFHVQQRYKKTTLLEAHLHTGRTHQIRVHAYHAGFPIVGDERYYTTASMAYDKQANYKRLCLHAKRIKITLEGWSQPLCFEVEANFLPPSSSVDD
ncbi:MAG: RluA family pseudouridine synthase [Gammaproteobacteria bacterium]